MNEPDKPQVVLVETIMEGGFMSETECKKALKGCATHPQIKAIISLIEKNISMAREDSEAPGASHQSRDESCGAAWYLRKLRTEINDMLYLPPELPANQANS
jgi:hypothetical protein